MNPRVTYLSPGPGNPDFLPVKAARRLREATVVFYPESTGRKWVKQNAGEDASLRKLPSPGPDAATPLLEAARERGRIVRVTPEGVLTREVQREIDGLAAGDVELEILPAIDRARAAALLAGIPLDDSGTVRRIRAGSSGEENDPGVESVPAENETLLVDYDTDGRLRRVARRLIEAGLSPTTPVVLVEAPAQNDQQTRSVSLGDLAKGDRTGNIPPRGIGILGQGVRKQSEPRWIHERPLHGCRILVTRPRSGPDRLASRLRREGARVLHYPSIRIRPLEDGLERLREQCRNLTSYDWIVFTSRNGVRFFFQALEQSNQDVRTLHRSRIACIGKGTARALRHRQLQADLIPDTYRAESLASSLVDQTRVGDRLLLARAGGARDVLPRRLERENRTVREIHLYAAEPAKQYRRDLRRTLAEGGADVITFTSSSTVVNLFELLGDPDLTRRRLNRLHCAAIGPITADSLRQRGVEVQVVPDQYDFQHLTEAIKDHYRDPDRRGQNAEVSPR